VIEIAQYVNEAKKMDSAAEGGLKNRECGSRASQASSSYARIRLLSLLERLA